MPEKEEKARARSQERPTCARKGRESESTVTSKANMCPKRKKKREHGHKQGQHVPEKEEKVRARSQERPTCAREGRESENTVTRKANMCPRRKRKREHGHKKGQHVPAKEEKVRARSQERLTCAREGRKSESTVTRKANMCPKRKKGKRTSDDAAVRITIQTFD
ncbi:hypothetical protein [Mesobacillus stamsii]|uniref:General stress protein YciG n=1 Tax=Mesobacillus stamsii TaxID=225347 RepID=A0ABU0FY02_9BACI|nr:hypothetical protein [Mesobacillus stamsii]MDQ0414794.1 general stress protein YciG [Mesobacillus stamsii]